MLTTNNYQHKASSKEIIAKSLKFKFKAISNYLKIKPIKV